MRFLASYSKGSFHLTTCSGMVLLVSIAAPSLQTAWVGGGLGGNAEFCVFQGVPGWSNRYTRALRDWVPFRVWGVQLGHPLYV